jgi:hypothetical protein
MFDIRKIKRSETKPYVFKGIADHDITLHTRPFSLDTREVFNDTFRARDPKPDEKEPETLFDKRMLTRAENIETLGRCCVASWEGVTSAGQPVECTPDKAIAFLQLLDASGYREEVTGYIQWALNPLSFREPLVSAEDLGKE